MEGTKAVQVVEQRIASSFKTRRRREFERIISTGHLSPEKENGGTRDHDEGCTACCRKPRDMSSMAVARAD
jgi:hypothetical protein